MQRNRQVERRLPANRWEQHVGLFTRDDLLTDFDGQGFNIGRIGKFRVGHNGCRIAVYQYDAIALKLEHARIRAVSMFGENASPRVIANVIKRDVEPIFGEWKEWPAICSVVECVVSRKVTI